MTTKTIGRPKAAESTTHTTNCNANAPQVQFAADAQAGKSLAIMLYNDGACSVANTDADFAWHSEWVTA